MKRIGNLYSKICSIENLKLADQRAKKGKRNQKQVQEHEFKKEENIELLHRMLVDKTYKTSKYETFSIFEPKERLIYKLPYFPDRICHHAIMNVLEPIFISMFTADSYSCIKGKGIHSASKKLKDSLKDKEGTKYCLKLDIQKFYPSIDHTILKNQLTRKYKDKDLLLTLNEIIDSSEGVPIGNYLSQYFANFYLTPFDVWLKQEKKVKYYFRYADDIVILSNSKNHLHEILREIKLYLLFNLKLIVKSNYQIFPTQIRGIDFVGYKHYQTHTLLRKTIKKNFAKSLKKKRNKLSIDSYRGWAKHCDSRNLIKKLLAA